MTSIAGKIDESKRHHYEVERELARRLRSAKGADERRALYPVVYGERIRLVPSHPLAQRAESADLQREEVSRQLRLIQPFVRPSTRFLEVGPGDCALALAVARQVAKVCAVDVSDALYDYAETPTNFELLLSDGVAVPVQAASFDLAFSSQVIEHLHPDDAVDHIREIWRALVPGGYFVSITPNRLSGPWDVSRDFDRVATGLHLREYTIGELAELLRTAGFSDVRCVVSWHGRHLSPLMPAPWVRPLEALVAAMPFALRRTAGAGLGVFKVVARKSHTAS